MKKQVFPYKALYYQAAFSPCFFHLADFDKSPGPPELGARTPLYFANSIENRAAACSHFSPLGFTADAKHCSTGQFPGFACSSHRVAPSLSPFSPVTRITVSSWGFFHCQWCLNPDGITGSQVSIPGTRSSPAHAFADTSAGGAQNGVNYTRVRWQ